MKLESLKHTYYVTAVDHAGNALGFYIDSFSINDAWDHAAETDGVEYVTAAQLIA
jgi:hypothetical protein